MVASQEPREGGAKGDKGKQWQDKRVGLTESRLWKCEWATMEEMTETSAGDGKMKGRRGLC
jgi:hypothetical protein